ncbi:MAG: hypothetical protein HDT21_03610 [Ruminococcus sp.]|nr:hypothetical protein [Ruminococcus sp.]
MKLKVNLQKIIAVAVSTAVITFAFASFPAFADSEPIMTNQEYYAAQSYLIAKYKDGKISYSEFQQQSQAVTDEFVTNNTVGGVLQAGALNASNTFNAVSQKIGNTVQKYGDVAREYIDDYVSNFFDSYTKLNNEPVFDFQGRGAGYRIPFSNYGNGKIDGYEIYRCDYVEIVDGGGYIYYRFYNVHRDIYRLDGSFWFTRGDNNIVTHEPKDGEKRYGDWRYANDGTQADTDDEFETISDYDFSQASERELEELLKKLLNEMELKEPDLSSIDGLLNAIYARLGTLDSDNDNSLLSQILTAIEAIKLENTDNSELLETLESLKDSLVYDDGEKVETIAEQLKKIIDNQLTVDDFTIDDELYNNKMEVLKLRFMGKFSFIHDLSDFVTYIFNSYSNSFDSPEINFTYGGNSYSVNLDYYKDILPLVQCIIAVFIYITYAYHTYRKIPSYINGGDNE